MKSQWMNSKRGQRTMWLAAAGLCLAAGLIGFIRKGSDTASWSALALGCMSFIFAFTVVEDRSNG